MKQTVLVAMSSGVDSSVAAALLVEQGHTVVGVTMKTFCYSETRAHARTCCGLDGIQDARRVADTLGIAHYVFDMEESFTAAVIDDFVSEYAAGRTPNPCVRCNSNTKIPDLLERGRLLGADWIATGHYARLEPGPGGRRRLLRGTDADKDQSYFLWGVPSGSIARLLFPVGTLTKPDVRRYARGLDLVTAEKPESQDICFVPTGTYADFLGRRLGADHPAVTPGRLVTRDGTVVGSHGGYGRYTVGQRRGLGGGFGTPLYVLGVRPAQNEVVVGEETELYGDRIEVADLNWLTVPPGVGDVIDIQIRHRARAVPARLVSIGPDAARFALLEPQRAITPGQSGAVYRGEELIGGGRIR